MSSAAEGATGAQASTSGQAPLEDPIVQWVVLRKDLWGSMGWPLGPVIAQACHASTAAMVTHLDDADTREYTAPANLDHMHKASHLLGT
jgi:hypothetical protein